jgi:hypothetical protein
LVCIFRVDITPGIKAPAAWLRAVQSRCDGDNRNADEAPPAAREEPFVGKILTGADRRHGGDRSEPRQDDKRSTHGKFILPR